MVISPKTLVAAIGCLEECLVFDKDWEKEITCETVDFMLYGKQCPKSSYKKGLVSFLRTANLTYVQAHQQLSAQHSHAQTSIKRLCN